MGYGLETVQKVDKIVGPGNVFVTSAKMQIRDVAEIDFPAGPSESSYYRRRVGGCCYDASQIIAGAEYY